MENKSTEAAVFEAIVARVNAHKMGDPSQSYSAKIFQDPKGLNKILEKVGEEATEVILAAKDGERSAILNEMADLWFHSLLILVYHGYSPIEVLEILQKRQQLQK